MSVTLNQLPLTGLERLRRSSELEYVAPEDVGFDELRLAWNRAYEHQPLAVVMPTSVAGVVEVVNAAREAGVSVGIQATGHGPTRTANGAILLDLSRLSHVRVDAGARRATISGGAKWQAVLDAVLPHGLAPLLGSSPDVGVVGYLLGGGIGWLQRPYGTAADTVRRFELVIADGRVIEATVDDDPELFWALRGAGAGHLGVVTEVELDLLEVTELYAGNLFYPAEMAADVMRRWRDWVREVPESLTSSVVLMNYPRLEQVPAAVRGRGFAIVRGAHVGPLQEAERLLAHWREWRAPLFDQFGSMPFGRIAEVSQDPVDPLPGVSAGLWLRGLSDATIDALVAATFVSEGPPPFVFSEVRHTARETREQADSLTTLTQSEAAMLLNLVAVAPTVDGRAAVRDIASRLRRSIEADLTGRHYLNLVEGDERRKGVADAFGPEALARLTAVKSRLDPERRFDHGLDVLS
jgi:FAD/FMN-containing dehydrogenase